MVRLGSLALFACLFLMAGAAAHAAKPTQAVFNVTLTATLTKDWTFTQVDTDDEPGGCARTTRGVGRWQTKLSTRAAGRVRAVAAGGGRIRFAGNVLNSLAGTATKSGAATTTAGGPPPCKRLSRSVRCGEERRRFSRASTVLTSPRKGILQLGPLRGADAIRFRSTCLEEPTDIRSIRPDLPLAAGPLDVGDVFDRRVPRWFVTGDTEQVTAVEGEVDGRVTERVRWTLNFRRVR
jgi:hypothetical protein